jgi:ribonucleoside-diphosphate reductase alpha chain
MKTDEPCKPACRLRRPGIPENGLKVLALRYLRRGPAGEVIESPDEMFWRVAKSVAAADSSWGGRRSVAESAERFYELMRRLIFLPNSPTLMNAGRELQQLAACFVLPIEDSLESIFEQVKNAALIHKSGGGSGFAFSRIRPKGERVRSTHGVSSGPVSFMRVFDAATDAVKQGGTRRGANMGVLRVDHPDVLEFIDAKADRSGLRNFNISVAVTDAFMEAAARGGPYPLIHPLDRRPAGHLDAREVFSRICLRAWECGDPGLIFLDTVNRNNPTPGQGDLECTNPCGEQPLLPYESCCLGSINLAQMTMPRDGGVTIDYRRLADTVRQAVHFLDNVIEVNEYPLPRISEVTRGNRKIGLGVMGWSDLLIRLGIPYASAEALALADRLMGFIQRTGHRASAALAERRGPYPRHAGLGGNGTARRRNATVTTIAPTGTISMIAGCSSGIEPPFALSYRRRHVLDGRELPEIHPVLIAELARRELDTPEVIEAIMHRGSVRELVNLPANLRQVYRTALEIGPEHHVRMQSAFQRHCDNAVSKTVNLPSESTPADVEMAYRTAYELGCKGVTVYRDRSRETQVLNAGCVACA